jgi:predicted DCC family thiol-disulfide oxidoreductase YuxK
VTVVEPVLIFDGDCGFCTSSANWVSVRWRKPARSVPWQRLSQEELDAYGLTLDEARDSAWWVDDSGRAWHGHLAIAESLRAGSGWSAALGRVLLVPPLRWIGIAMYPLISRWRHHLPGGTPACRIRQ